MRELLFWALLASIGLLVTGSDTVGVFDFTPTSELFVCKRSTSCIRLQGYETVTANLASGVMRHFGVDAIICRAAHCPKPRNPLAPLMEYVAELQ